MPGILTFDHWKDQLDEIQFDPFQRVKKLRITPRPNAVELAFETTKGTVPIVEIFREVRNSNGELQFSTDLLVKSVFDFLSAWLGNRFTVHNGRIPGLNQDTRYSYRITASDGSWPSAVVTGTFRTGTRSADFLIRDIQMFNDGDPGIFGASGELEFSFGFYNDDGAWMGTNRYFGNISAGEVRTWPLGKGSAFRFSNAPDRVGIFVRGIEYDLDLFSGSFKPADEPPLSLPETVGHYEDDDKTLAEAMQRFELPNTSGTFSLPLNLNSGPWGIHYVITGRVEGRVTSPLVLPEIPDSAKVQTIKPKTIAALSFPGQQAIIQREASKPVIVALGPDGLLAYKHYPGRKEGWKKIEKRNASSFTVVSGSAGKLEIFAVTDREILHSQLDPDSETAVHWRTIGSGLQAPLTAIGLADNRLVLLTLDSSGVTQGLLFNETADKQDWQSLGGNFAGQVSALSKRNKVDMVAVTADGQVHASTWSVDSSHAPSWTPIGDRRVRLAAITKNDSNESVIIAVTAEREALLVAYDEEQGSKKWTSLGNFDALTRDRFEQTQDGHPDQESMSLSHSS